MIFRYVLLIYTQNITSRLQYITKTLLGDAIELTNNKEQFILHAGIKINYSAERIDPKELWIQPHNLLFEREIKEQQIDCFEWNGLKVFFKTNADLPFDIFAASFYLLSRYEEYLPHTKDEYGRYDHKNSIAYKENFLQLPLVNLWMKEFEKEVEGKRCKAEATSNLTPYTLRPSPYPLNPKPFTFLPTYDIDIAFAYRHQPLYLNIFGFYRDLLTGNIERVLERGNVYSGNKKDPFDVFDWLDQLHEQHQLNPLYFFLLADKRKGVDKNVSPRKKAMQNLVKKTAEKYDVGIHPSWQSGNEESREPGVGSRELETRLLNNEISILEKSTQHKITKNRQHYLRFTIPQTFRRLIEAGIKEEYSMAYGNINGFRASYTLPFYWFDLERNETTDLLIHPFCFMEATAVFEQKYSVEQTAEELQYYFDMVRSVNGEFISLFHNHFLTEQQQWLPWRKMYEDFLQKNF